MRGEGRSRLSPMTLDTGEDVNAMTFLKTLQGARDASSGQAEEATAFSLRDSLTAFGKCFCQGARLMVGVPDYDTYVAHIRRTHPDQEPMTYAAFFRERQDARYGGSGKGGFRCC